MTETTQGQDAFAAASISLRYDSRDEFDSRQTKYGDTWLKMDLDTLCSTVRAEAHRIRPEMDKETLRHRIADLNAYLTMLYWLTDENYLSKPKISL